MKKNKKSHPVGERLIQIRELLGYKTPKAFAVKYDIKYTTYKSYEDFRIPTSEFLLRLTNEIAPKVNLDWILTGQGEMYRSDMQQATNNLASLAHQNLVTQFKNQDMAEAINRTLLEIEKIDESKMEYVKGVVDTLYSLLSPKIKNG